MTQVATSIRTDVPDPEPSMRRRLWSSPLVYVLAVAAYPVVFLWAANLQEAIQVRAVVAALVVVLMGTLAIWLVARIVIGDPHRASFATAAIVLPFLVFGRLTDEAGPFDQASEDLYLFIGALILMSVGVVIGVKARWVPRVARVANPVACALLALNIVPILASPRADDASAAAAGFGDPVVLPAAPPASRPDVYYLILDRYANERVLREQYGFDNGPFLEELRSRGFTVLDDIVSNYPRTIPSLASSLNMGYLSRLAEVEGPDSQAWGAIMALVERSRVSTTFQRLGYRSINIASWWGVTAYDPGADENVSFFQDEFEYVFWRTTMLPTLARYTPIPEPNSFLSDVWGATPKQFDAVARIADDPEPTFTFGHFLVPHPPYVFRADGRPAFRLPRLSTDEAYIEQVRYTNARVVELLDRLMASSSPGDRPIIVIQADEGPFPRDLSLEGDHYDFYEASQPDLERKQGILSALYLPGHEDTIPEFMTPVNTFRLILSGYFGADLPLLPDRAYVYRDHDHPFELHDVTARLRAGMEP